MSRILIATLVAVVVVAIGVAAARPKWHELTPDYSYSQFLQDFKKAKPTSDSEYKMREQEFTRSLRKVFAHNIGNAKSSYKKGINHMSDWTDAERTGLRGGRAGSMAHIAAELHKKPYVSTHQIQAGRTIPQELDYRQRFPSILTTVKDQGQCGSCWAHGSTEQMETYNAIATDELFVLSQQQVTACAPNPNDCGGTGGCGGSIMQLAWEYVINAGGITQEWNYPYTAYNGNTGTCESPLPPTYVKLTGYKVVTPNSQNAVLDALVGTGPLSVNVDASSWSDYEGGIFDGCHYAQNISIDHVVQLVGYGHDFGLGKSYWLIRNSWSASYGEQGFIRILKTEKAECGTNVNPQDGVACKGSPPTQYVCGECGILFSTGYPVV